MRLDFKSLAFGYNLENGVSTPAWETSLGQGAGYKINDSRTINELIKGMIYKMVAPKAISFKKGRGGTIVRGDADNASLVSAAVFDKIYINDHHIADGKFILLIVKDDSESHRGRLKLKYGLDNAYERSDGTVIKNRDFHNIAAAQLGLADNACWFIYDISVEDQDVLRLSAIIVNKYGSETYANSTALHNAWDTLIEEDISNKGFANNPVEQTNDIEVVFDASSKNLSAQELVERLNNMYSAATSGNQSNAIRMFGFKYAESIIASGVAPQKLVDDSIIDSNSYGGEITKAINMYNSIKNNEYGITFADAEFSSIAEKSFSESDFLSKEWFKEMANNYPGFDERANELIATFNEKFNPDILEKLSGIDLLNNVFLNPDNPDNLCRALEFNPELTEFFGSIKGGNSYKYGLFYSSNGAWMTGSHQKPRELTQDEAINIGTEIRDRLVAGARIISSYGPVNEIDDYKKLYKLLEEATNGDINKVWFMKYYQMLYPDLFAPNYSDYAQRIVLGSLGIEKEKYPLVRMGQIRFFADEFKLSNVLFSKIFWDNYEEPVIEEETSNDAPITFNTGYKSDFARNRILFGAPGTGKSFTLNGDRKEILYGDREIDESTIDLSQYGEYERVTFHPDYSYANFVGTYKPVPCKDENDKDGITYEYVPGPFMRTYVKALLNSKTETPKPYLLIIEEINRANVAAVFGDVFQLLDRGEDEVSEYPIQASEDMKKYLAKALGGDLEDYAEIRIPDNMFIWATMNSADQGVFPMDTAFKRRWDFTYLGIDDSEDGISQKTVLLGMKIGTQDYRRVVEWNELRKAINEELLKYKVNEDKLMGPYFISKKNLPEGNIIDPEEFSRIFKNKVIMYLFDDAAKQKRASLFEGCEEKSRNQYSKICNEFDEKGVLIFGNSISDRFTEIPKDDEQ